MLIPCKWLREFVAHDLSAQEVSELLTMTGLEVDAVVQRHQGLGPVVIAQVTQVEPHPNADKLRLATVEHGGEPLTVVCGAPNVRPGMFSVLARQGAELPGGFKVGKAKIRGVESRGMLCSARELGIGDDHSGILDLPGPLTPGVGVVEALNLEDQVLEISVTPNRGDALSVLGVARDLAAALGLPITMPRIEFEEYDPPMDAQASVTLVDPQGCPRYAARLVNRITIAPSPLWMMDRVQAAGMRPINNVVDVTNYVLMELGQPLHAFDFTNLEGRRIVVRQAEEGETFVTLDGQERKLSAGMLLICDGKRPVALAGIMGGLNSEVEPTTNQVLIEAAFFDPLLTRRTSKRLGLSTEASFRFERAIDQDGCATAADRAAQLMAELAGGQVARGIIDAYPTPRQPRVLPLSVKRTAAYLGLPLTREQVVTPLVNLGLTVEQGPDDDSLLVTPTAARTDLERPVDLTEEVARVHGYDNIPAKMPVVAMDSSPRARRQVLRNRARDLMAAQGFDEVINLSYAHPAWVDMLSLPQDDPRRRVVKLMNPLSEDQSVLRTSLLPGLFSVARHNLSHRVERVAIFEVGNCFWLREGEKLPQEPARLAGVLCGLADTVAWWAGERPVSLAHGRGAVEYLVSGLGFTEIEFAPLEPTPPYLEPGTACVLLLDGRPAGETGCLAPKVAHAFDLEKEAIFFDLDFDLLVEQAPQRRGYTPLPRYPEVIYDVALVVDNQVGAGGILAEARAFDQAGAQRWLTQVELFDLYRGKPLDKDQKSLGLRFTYRDLERTLTEEEVLPVHQALVEHLLERFAAKLRG